MGLNGKQLLENFKEDEAYGNTTYTPPDDSSDDDNGDNAWKYISAGDISGLADYTNRNYNYRTIPFLGQIVGHAADAATQGVADAAQFVGAQGVGDYLNEKAQEGEAELPAMSTPELSLAYLTDPNGLASAFGMMAGSMLSMVPVAAIAPELLPARAAMILSKVPKALSAVPKIGGALEEMAPMAGRFALTGPIEAMMEGGNTEREMLQNGATPEEARQAAWNVFGENVGLLTATNALEGGLLGKIKIKTPHFSNPVVNTASRVAGYVPTTAAEMALQGYEEGAQQGIQNGVEGESPNTANQILNPFAWTDDQWYAAKFGAAGAAPLMGAMGAIRHFGNRGDNGSTAADSLLDQAQDDIDSITSQAAQQSVIQSAQQDMENNPYTAPTAMQDTSYEAPSDTSSGSSYDASALEGDPGYTVSGEVSSTDVTPLTDQKMRLLDSAYYNKYGQHLFVTSMKRNGDGSSWHDSGQAFDTADDNLENNKEARDWLISEGEKLGLTPLDEYEHPSAGATGGHIHFSDHGEPIPDGIRVGESDSDMDDSDTDDSTGGVDLSNLPVGDIAMAIAQNTNLPVNFIWSQLSHESDGGKSKLAVEDHNYGGVKGTDGNYLHFDNDQQFIDYMSNYYPKYREDGIYDAKTADQFAEALQHGGYFTADLGEYEGGMHRYLEQAGLSQDAMFGGKARRAGRKGGDSTSSTPDLSGSFEISADDPAMDSMFASFAKDWQNMSTDANEINFFGDMFNSRNKFKATEENKQAILDNYGDAFRQYVQENQPQTVQAAQTAQAPAQPKQAPQPQHIEMQTPNLQTITTPKVEATTIQNVLSSFVQDKKNVARTEQEANLFDDMLDADDHFIDTPKNRQTLLKNYGAQLQDYVDDAMTPSLTDRVNQAIEQAVQNKDLNRMNTLTQAKQANDTAALEKLVGPQTKQHVDIAAMLTPANTDMKNPVSSTVQANAPVYQTVAQAAPQSTPQAPAQKVHIATATPKQENALASIPDSAIAAAKQADDGFSAPLNIFSADEQKALRNAGLVYDDANYNGTERVKVDPLYEEGDRRMKSGKAKVKAETKKAGKVDKYKKDAEKIYLRFKSGKFSADDSVNQLENLKKKATSDKVLSDEEKAEVVAEADNQIHRIKPQKETKEHETQKHNSKTAKTAQGGKAEGYPHQHAEPEPRKTADTQREAEEGEVKRRETRDKYYESVISDPRWKEIENELTPDGVKRMKKALAYSTSKHKKKLDRDIVLYRLYDTWVDYRGIAHDDMGLGVKGLREPQHGALNNIRKIAALQDKVDAIMADHYQDSGNKKAANDGGHTVQELAPRYKTESGKPLSEADEKEFILKPDGSKDFGEITDAISKAAKEQSGVDLAPGKIRLRVGNDKEGLLHAKKHEGQAKVDGYASIEDMIADVAENFDSIYAHGLTGDGHTTYSLIKHGNKATGKMNGVAPVYLNLEDDGHGNYYVIVTAIPKGDANLARQTKKDRLIYSSPGLGAATESNAGAVSTSAKNVGAETRGGTPTSDKSSGSSTHIIPHEQKEGAKNLDSAKVPDRLSKEAQGVYIAVRDKLHTSKSKAHRAADVSAEILARHADAYAKAYSKATGKQYTATDYMRDKIGIDTDGNAVNDEKAKRFFQTAWHGSPHDFDRFDLGAIGTGEGAQVHGWGLYFAANREVSEGYKDFLSRDVVEQKHYLYLLGEKYDYPDGTKLTRADGSGSSNHIFADVASLIYHLGSINAAVSRLEKLKLSYEEKGNTGKSYHHVLDALKVLQDSNTYEKYEEQKRSTARLYRVDIPDEKDMLEENKPYSEMSAKTHYRLKNAYKGLSEKQQKSFFKAAWPLINSEDGKKLEKRMAEIHASSYKLRQSLQEIEEQITDIRAISSALNQLASAEKLTKFRYNTVKYYLNKAGFRAEQIDTLSSSPKAASVARNAYEFKNSENLKKLEQKRSNLQEELISRSKESCDELFSAFNKGHATNGGRRIYDALTAAFGDNQRKASLWLNKYGIKGIAYNGGRDGRCYVVFDDKAISIINKYNQMENSKELGYTTAIANGKRIVTLLSDADESTFLHEMGHVFLLDLQDLAEIDQTSANDMAAVESWATWKKGQAKDYKGTAWEQEFADREKAIAKAMADGDEETVNQLKDEWMQERFARGFERYLESGEAPSSKLKSVFEKFKQFLTRIYNAFKGAGGKPSEDVKNVMARMMDSDVENTIKVPAMGEPIHGIKGTETTVVTDSGKEIRVRYLVVPASRVITSHDAETMTPNKAYPQELQPRDRQRVSMQEQVTTMANELRPADLGAGRNLNQGAPIIRKDGVVLNGNGRAMAIQKATAAGGNKATAYRKYIFEHSKEFGLSRVNLAQVRKYMLVREVVDDIDADTMQDIIGSTAGGSRMGASEQAKADAKKIKPRDLERYVDNEQGDLTTAANQDFVAGILYRIVSKNERNAYTDEHGNVNADGIQRVKRALFLLAYNDNGLIDKMAESTDDNIRNVSRGLMSAAPAFARVNLAVKDGQAYEYDAGKTISDAVKHLDALRREGKPVKDYLNEQSMFSEYQDTDEVREVLRFFDDNKRSGKKIGIFLNDIANSIMMQGDPNQTSLMDGGRATLGEIIKTSARVASNGTSSADLFADVQEAPTKAKENTTQAIDDIRYSAKQNDAQVKRSLQAVVDEAKKAFPNAKNIRQDGGHISMDMPNGAEVQINVVPSIEVNNEEAGRARAAHGLKDDVRIKINGGERTVGRTALIELSQLGRKGTAYHEAFHAVYDMCLTNEEKAALHKAYDKEAKAKGRDVYEVMADKYRDWMLAQQKGQHTLFGKLWQKVKSAVIRLLHLIRGADNARDVFRKVGSGEVWERQLNSKDSGNRYLVTNDQIRPDTEVPIIDVTDEPRVNVNNHHAAADIARSMIGKTFRIIGSDGYGKIASVSDGTHFVHSSNNPVRFDKTRRKALSVAEKILGNCVYIEKHGDLKHGTKQSYIEMFSVVKDGNRLVRFRIVAKEGNKDSHAFRIGEAKFYDIIKDGALQESGVLRHYKHEGAPSTLTIAELLKGVKDREGHLYVNKDGSLNYDTRIFHNGEEQGGSPSDVRNSADLFAIRPGEPTRYSLDANDNSKPSLFTRAYNHLTGRKNAASHDKNVKAMLEDITKMRIRFGKLDPKTETVFKKFEGVIRARNANEWEKVLPEAGRAIADRLNLKPSEDMNNYIAKWLLNEATNDTSQEASDFAAALKNDPVLSDQLVDLKTLFNERNNREADEVVRDAIQYEKPKERTTLTKAWETFYDEMIEELGPVKRMVKRVQEKSGQELAASVNPYIALRLFRGNAGRAMTMIEGQSEAAIKALQTNYPGVNFNGFKTLHMILDECGALHNEKRMKDFLAFALACHVKDIHTLNNRIRKSQQRLRDKIADLNDKINNLPEYQQLIESDKKVDDKYQEQREAYQKEIEGYQAKIDKAEKTIMEVPRTEDGLSLTEDRCNKVMMKYMKEYGEAQQDLVHFSKVTTSILYDAGVISKKRYKELQERWPNYIPMFRVFEDNEEVDFGDSLKHMHGSTRRIINPLDSIIRNTYDFVKKAEKNKARQLLADLTRISDVGEYIEEVDNSKPNDKTTITFYENGERKYLQTDPDIVKAVNNMGREESNWVLRLLHAPAKIARACFTTINPSFALRNLIRDSTDASIYSKYGFKPWDFVRGFLHAVHRDELFYEWLSSGAAQASAISLDRDYTQATLNQMSKTWKERLLSKEFLPAILEGMQMVGEYSEYGTRIAAYERAKKKLAGENGPHPAAYDLASAALESRDLMDFARGGRGSRYLNNVVVFANASIQGFDKFFRTFDFRKPYRKESMKALARLFLCGMLPALLLAGIHSGDDWWEELPDWQKETNWILGKVGNTIIRIPKGQDIGLRFFSNLIEKAMDRSKHKAGDYFKPVWDSLPDMIPTALLPIIEATANHSYFTGAPVVPKYQEKLPAYLQFGNETSSFAKFVGKVIGVSPRKVEHVLFGYTGNMGKGLLGVYDTIVGNQSLNTNLNEAPVISGFTAIPYKQSKTVNDFYDKFDEQQRLNEEFKLTKKKPDGYDPSLYKRMTKAQQELSKINKQERAAIDDPKMDSGVREQKQLGYQQQRLSVVRRVMGQ